MSALQVADRENVVVFNTLSKRSSMTGYRSGFVCAPPEVADALRAFRPSVGTAPQEFVQRASVAAWSDEEHVERRARRLPPQARDAPARARGEGAAARGRRRDVLPLARGRRARRSRSRGGCSSTASSSRPGSFFGPAGEGYVRFALVPTQAECERAAAILEEAL